MDSRAENLASPRGSDEVDEETIAARIFKAIGDRRLASGTKLSESVLCEAFGVGRMRARRALLLLASRNVVELIPNRGAFVASPTPDEAREIFEARLSVEPQVARLAADRADAAMLGRLTDNIRAEQRAHLDRDRHQSIDLSAEFHLIVAEMTRNRVLLGVVRDLVTRSSLIIGLFGATGVSSCREDDHGRIAAQLADGDGEGAAASMRSHIEMIGASLDFRRRDTAPPDLVSFLRD